MSGPGSVFKPILHFTWTMPGGVHLPMKLHFLGRRGVRAGHPGRSPRRRRVHTNGMNGQPRAHHAGIRQRLYRGVDGQPIPCRDRRGRTAKQADECDAERGDPTHRWRCMIGSLHLRNVEHDAGQRHLLGW